jgi:chemotaxis protein MotA
MTSLPLGFLVMIIVGFFVFAGTDIGTIVNSHGLLIVAGGTFGIMLLSTPIGDIAELGRNIMRLFRSAPGEAKLVDSLTELAKNREATLTNSHPLITFAQELWSQGVEDQMFEALVIQRTEELSRLAEGSVAALRNLAKYPPALGMTGTVLALVTLFTHLGVDAKTNIGPELALALTATFYGLALSNGILMPLSDRLHVKFLSDLKTNEQVCKMLLLVHQNEPLSLVTGDDRAQSA